MTSNAKVKCLCACLGLMLSASFLGGCASLSWQSVGGDLPVLDQESMRSDTPQAVDQELQKRFAKKEAAAQAMFSHDGDGRLVLHHKYGTTVLPDQPQRVVVIGLEDPMVALGAPMVAAHDRPDSYLHQALSAQGVDNIYINDSTNTINLEQVQAEKPDLIILRDSYDRNAYVALSKIAPVAAFDLQDAETALLAMAITLGQPERGAERLHQYYDIVKQARLAIKSHIGNSSVALVRVLKKEIRLYPYPGNAINKFMYDLLNLYPPPLAVAMGSSKNMALSLEAIPDFQCDYILVSCGYGMSSGENNNAAQRRYESLQADPLWQHVPAVREGHVKEVDSVVWNSHGIIAKEAVIKELRDWLAP